MIQRLRHALDLRSVRTRLMVWNLCIVALLLAVLGAVVQVSIDRVLQSAVDNDLSKYTDTLMVRAQELLYRDREQVRNEQEGSNGPGRSPNRPPQEPPPEKQRGPVESTRSLQARRRDMLVPLFLNVAGIAMRPYEQMLVRISDTGEDIAPEHLPHLGDRFYRVDSARGRAQGGTGLSLSICKSLLEEHDGSLAFESAIGQGTTAIVTLPSASQPH